MGKIFKWVGGGIIGLLVLVVIIIVAASTDGSKPVDTSVKPEIDIMQVVNKKPKDVENILDKPSKFGPLESGIKTGTYELSSGRHAKADQGIYKKQNMQFEVVYLEDVAQKIMITYPGQKYDYGKDIPVVLKTINLPFNVKPTFANDITFRWEKSLNGLYEVQIFPTKDKKIDYMYISVDEKYK